MFCLAGRGLWHLSVWGSPMVGRLAGRGGLLTPPRKQDSQRPGLLLAHVPLLSPGLHHVPVPLTSCFQLAPTVCSPRLGPPCLALAIFTPQEGVSLVTPHPPRNILQEPAPTFPLGEDILLPCPFTTTEPFPRCRMPVSIKAGVGALLFARLSSQEDSES